MIDYHFVKDSATSVRRRMVAVADYCSSPIHWGSSLSCVEIIVYTVGLVAGSPVGWADCAACNELIVSKGHAALAYYAVLAEYGLISDDYIYDYQKDESDYTEELMKNPRLGITCTTGSLGIGLPYAVGRAIRKGRNGGQAGKVYCIVGDGELDEGSVWEAVMLASQLKLNNLILLVDFNGLQSDGATKDILSWQSIESRFSSFGWNAEVANGHDIKSIDAACRKQSNVPLAVICHTIKGKGISFMENNSVWHDKALRGEYLERARAEVGSF